MIELADGEIGSVGDLREEIQSIYLTSGARGYGLYELNQIQHALQSASHAEQQGLPSALVIACLLHDVGHMVHELGETPAEGGVDDLHEEVGAKWTAARFPPAVSEPIRLHVAAKRYLCATEPRYLDTLSKDSLISLRLQGGAMPPEEQESFLRKPFAQDAIRLRRIDELAKDKGAVTSSLEHYLDTHLSAALKADS